MNGEPSTPAGENPTGAELPVEPHETPLVVALESLFMQDERWKPVPSPGGATLIRAWEDETADTVVILSPDTAYAWREDPRGREILRVRGTAERIIATVHRWPAPSEPGAPDGSDHLPGPSGRWT